MKITKLVIGIFFIGLLMSSCGESDPKDVNVKLQMSVGNKSLIHDNIYNINNIDVKFINVAFYLGDIKFETSDGTIFESMESYYLIKPGIYDFNFTVPEEVEEEEISLSKISFFVGVDPETNAETEMDFTERTVGDPLGQQNPTMHWGWAGGYRFMNIDGNADLDGDGEFETPLTYHLGKDDLFKNITLSPNQKIEEGKNEFNLKFDMNAFLANIDFATENFTKVQPDNLGLANKLFDNYNSTFVFAK
jgi:hypothetical protein